MRTRVLALVVAIAGCRCDTPSKPAGSAGSARPEAAAAAADAGSEAPEAPARSTCTAETAIRVSRVLTDPAHPCRRRILAAYGRMVRVGAASSGTIVSTAGVRGAGLLVTCRTCAGAAGAELEDPERDPPRAIRIGPPARLAGDAVPAGEPRYAAHRLFGDGELSLAAISGAPLEPDAAVPPAVSDRDLALDDPRGLAGARAPFLDARPGASVLVLGFEGGELVASVGPVLGETEARRLIARAGALSAEAGLGHDPQTELAIAAGALPGMIGGGVFDEGGRFVGVVTRATAEPPLVRAVRATSIAQGLSAALRSAPVPLRTRILPFLP